MSKNILKALFILSIVSMVFVGGDVLAATCGSATGQGWPTAPTTNLCSDGTVSGSAFLNQQQGNWFWICSGGAAPTFIFCSAPLTSANGWMIKASWAYPRTATTVASTGSKIYAIGGYRTPLEDSYNSIEEYNPTTNTWTDKDDTYSYENGMAASVGGYIYFIGGNSSIITGSNKRYSPGGDSWTTKASMPTPRRSAAAAVAYDKIYIMGGYVPSGYGWTAVNEEYNPGTNTWTTKASMPSSRMVMGAATVNNKIYVIGGIWSVTGSATNINEEYDPATNTWTTKAPMPTARYATYPVVYNNKIYVIGGYNGSWVTVNEVYDPATNTWTTANSMPQAVNDAVVAVANNKIYVMGGYDGKITLEYDPAFANGTCGSSNGGTFSTAPTTNLCTAGTATGVTFHGGLNNTWTWSCTGMGGGTTADCSAGSPAAAGTYDSVEYNGSGNGTMTVNITNLGVQPTQLEIRWSTVNNPPEVSDIQKVVPISETGIHNISMENLVPGSIYYTNIVILASNVVVSLGSKTLIANRQPIISGTDATRTVNEGQSIVLNANASDPDGDSLTYLWSCTGLTGVFTPSASVLNPTFNAPWVSSTTAYNCNLTVNDGKLGIAVATTQVTVNDIGENCGTAHGHGYQSTSYIDTSAERCALGAFGGTFTDNGSYWSWACGGSACSANKVSAGSFSNTIRKDEPSTNLCAYGNASTPSLIDDIWYWTCSNNPGVDAAAYAFKTTCGSSNGGSFSSPPSTNLCKYGTASSVTTNPSTYTWTCTGDDSLPVDCSATKTEGLVNGSCGTAQGQLYSSVPSENLCSAGTPSSVTTNSTTYTWACNGSGGGSNANCSSNRISFKNPYDVNGDESCWFCEHYYDAEGILRDGKLSNGIASLEFRFTTNASDYNSYKLAIGTINDVNQAMKTDEWLSISSSETTFSGARVRRSGTDQKEGNNGFLLTYGNGTSTKTYYWWVKLRKPSLTETDWMYGGTLITPKKAFPLVRVAADKATATVGTDIQYCTTLVSLTNTADPCYPVCWTGTGDPVVDPDNSNWKCSVCYNSSNQPVQCTSTNGNAFSWILPEQSGSYMNTTNASSTNPIFRLSTTVQNLKPGLAVMGSECAGEGETGTTAPLPKWREVSPF